MEYFIKVFTIWLTLKHNVSKSSWFHFKGLIQIRFEGHIYHKTTNELFLRWSTVKIELFVGVKLEFMKVMKDFALMHVKKLTAENKDSNYASISIVALIAHTKWLVHNIWAGYSAAPVLQGSWVPISQVSNFFFSTFSFATNSNECRTAKIAKVAEQFIKPVV